jgi:pyruvate dehydrogenase E2 component (dihydrolipoamide acetyltransferase)
MSDSRLDTPAPASTRIPLTATGRTMARRMDEAWKAPVFHLTVEADAQTWDSSRDGYDGVTLTDVLLMRCARALMSNPKLNAHYDAGDLAVTQFERADIGLAVATDRGLLVPVLRGVEAMSLDEIATARRALVERARAGRLSMAEMQGGTFTISNLGMLSVLQFDAILNIPQVAILAVGAIQARTSVVDGQLADQRVMSMTLTCDHRAVDGATGALFLRELVGRTASETTRAGTLPA